MNLTMSLEEKIKSSVREVMDYPKPGIGFKDITPVLANPVLMKEIVHALISFYKPMRIDAVAAVEARGFILGSILAYELGCRFLPVRKTGKLPYQTIAESYDLEYGSAAIEMHVDAVLPGNRILIHDDLLATGGTAAATARLVKASGGELAGFSFLINLSFLPGEKKLLHDFGLQPDYLVQY
jgi:adenine phosphoribosyltransferase